MDRLEALRILGLHPDATQDEIKQAFRKLAKQHHPDVGGDKEHFKKINEAYNVLVNKKDFDLNLDVNVNIDIDIKNIMLKAEEATKKIFNLFGFETGEFEIQYKCPVCGEEWVEKSFIKVTDVVEEVCGKCRLRLAQKLGSSFLENFSKE